MCLANPLVSIYLNFFLKKFFLIFFFNFFMKINNKFFFQFKKKMIKFFSIIILFLVIGNIDAQNHKLTLEEKYNFTRDGFLMMSKII